MNIFCFGLSHQTAALDVGERFATATCCLPEALAGLKTMPGVVEGPERTLGLRKQESAKCHQLIEHHVQDFQLWIERTQSLNFPSMVVELQFLKTTGVTTPL